MSGKPDWTGAEIRTLKRMIESGALYHEVASALDNRSAKAVDNMIRRLRLGRGPKRYARSTPTIVTVTPEQDGSERLRIAVLTALMRHANDNAIDIDTAAYRLISKGVR